MESFYHDHALITAGIALNP